MQLCVAGLAQGHQIIIPMRPALRKGDNVMDFLHRSQPTFLQAQLTQRMRRSIAVADSFPSPAILLVTVSRPLVPVVLNPHSLSVFLTVRFIGEPATARVTARALWFSWQSHHLSFIFRAIFFKYFRISCDLH